MTKKVSKIDPAGSPPFDFDFTERESELFRLGLVPIKILSEEEFRELFITVKGGE